MSFKPSKLDWLEMLARQATPWDEGDAQPASPEWMANMENNGNFCRAANPETILKLIAVARAAQRLVGHYYSGDELDLSHIVEALKKALEGLE